MTINFCNPQTMGWNCVCSGTTLSRLQPPIVPVNSFDCKLRNGAWYVRVPVSSRRSRIVQSAGVSGSYRDAARQVCLQLPGRVQLHHRLDVRHERPGHPSLPSHELLGCAQVLS